MRDLTRKADVLPIFCMRCVRVIDCVNNVTGQIKDNCPIKKEVDELPSAEPEIVRCKDCIHRPIDTGKDNNPEDFEFPDDICPCVCADFFYSWIPDDDWFCANGERMDGE